MEASKLINRRLKELYGLAPGGQQKFRLVWSEGLTEKRKGTFSKYYGEIFLGEYTGVEVCRKYAYLKEKWVLEVYTDAARYNSELLESDGYEPIYVFQDKDQNYLPPNWNVTEIVLRSFMEGLDRKPKSAREIESEENSRMEKEIETTEQFLKDIGSSTLETKFHDKEAVIIHKEE